MSLNSSLARNTLLLYVRMFLIMGVTFFTTRVVFQTLGVDDYGVYNTIGGIVILFSFINNALLTTTQRYLNFYYGKNDNDKAGQYFSACLVSFICIGVIISILSELAGLWFIRNKMVMPADREIAAEWVLHISVIVNFINIIRSPYHACLVANEKFDFYSYLSILEVFLKLAIVYFLTFSPYDKLISYNILILIVTLVIFLAYKLFCNLKYKESLYKEVSDKSLYKEVITFSSYSLLGNAANVCSQQGTALILNTFCGVIVNASVGISNQVSSGIYNFVSNFQTAFNPRLVKQYAQGNFDKLSRTIFQVSKFSFYLLFILVLPIISICNELLELWLTEVPKYTAEFCMLTLCFMLIDTLAAPLWITIQAYGKIKNYQFITSMIILCNIPLSYVVLWLELSPTYVFIVRIAINFIAYMYRFLFVKNILQVEIKNYMQEVLMPILKIVTLCFIVYILINLYISNIFTTTILMLLASIVIIYLFGLSVSEKRFITFIIKNKIFKNDNIS